VVLLHGIGSDSATWDVIAWPDQWRLLAFDLRGHGRSPWTAEYELSDMVTDVIGMLDSLGLPQVDLVGHSMGAMVAYLLAERAPERVRCLILAEPPPPTPASPPRHEGDRPVHSLTYDWRFQAPFSRQRNSPDPSWWSKLTCITANTLILAGRNGSFPIDDLTAMADRIPDCQLLLLDAGHQIHQDQPSGLRRCNNRFAQLRTPQSSSPGERGTDRSGM
jgi:3-oxoadipate enol-lactonase